VLHVGASSHHKASYPHAEHEDALLCPNAPREMLMQSVVSWYKNEHYTDYHYHYHYHYYSVFSQLTCTHYINQRQHSIRCCALHRGQSFGQMRYCG